MNITGGQDGKAHDRTVSYLPRHCLERKGVVFVRLSLELIKFNNTK